MKHRQAARSLAAMGVDQGDRHGSGAVSGQDFHQFTGVEQVLHVVARDLHQPQPGAAAGDIAFGVVDHHPAGQFEPLRMAVVGQVFPGDSRPVLGEA